MRAGGLALALHGAVLGLAWMLVSGRAARPLPAARPSVAEIPIEIVEPLHSRSPVVASPGPPVPGEPARAGAGPRGHVLRAGARRSLTRAPAIADPWADIQVSYEAPDARGVGEPAGAGEDGLGAARVGTGLGAALTGSGLGGGGGGLPGGVVPPAPPASHATPPIPRRYYTRWRFQGTRNVWGQVAQAELAIDARGRVRDVRMVIRINSWIDSQAVELAHSFAFYPAQNDAGEPIAGTYMWRFVVE